MNKSNKLKSLTKKWHKLDKKKKWLVGSTLGLILAGIIYASYHFILNPVEINSIGPAPERRGFLGANCKCDGKIGSDRWTYSCYDEYRNWNDWGRKWIHLYEAGFCDRGYRCIDKKPGKNKGASCILIEENPENKKGYHTPVTPTPYNKPKPNDPKPL